MGGAPPPPPPPPPSYPGSGYGAPPRPGDALGRPLAEWWQRLVAVIIDSVILVIPTIIVAEVLGGGGMSFIGVIGVPAVYYALGNGGDAGQTLGKKAMSIQVRDAAAGGPIGPGRAAVRYLVVAIVGSFTFGLFTLIDALWPLWDPRRQALHDKIVQSVVVSTAPRGITSIG